MDRERLKADLRRLKEAGASEEELRAFVRRSAAVEAPFTPAQRRQLKSDLEQLRADGYGEDDLRDYVRGFREGFASPGVNTSLQPFLQGATLGYGDELRGAARSFVTGRSRLHETARARGQLARARTDRPIGSAALEVGGSLAPAVATGAGVVGVLGRGASVLGNVARGAAAGALEGGVYGSGAEVGDADERAGAAVPGAAVGGIAGAIVAPVAQGASALWRAARGATSDTGAERQAARALRKVLEESNGNEVNIPSRLRQAQRDGVPLTLAEAVGQQGTDLLEAAAQAPGRGREAVVKVIGERQRDQPRRIVDALTRSSGVDGGSLARKLAEREARGAAAGPLYDQLRGIDLPDDLMSGFRSLLQSGGGKRAYRFAQEIAEQAKVRGEGAGLPPLEELLNGGRLTVAEADRILQGFENAAQRQMVPGPVPGRQSDTPTSLAYNRTARWLREQMEKRVPEFAQAREAWAGPSRLMEGIDLGQKAAGAGMDLGTFKTTWREADAATQEGIKIGLVNGLKAQLEQMATGEGADATRLIAKRHAVREKLRLALGGEAEPLLRALDLEERLSQTARQALGSSATARRLAAAEALGEERLAEVPTSVGGLLGRALGYLDQHARERTRAALARLGLVTDPDEAAEIVDRLLNRFDPSPRVSAPAAAAGGVGSAVARPIVEDRERR